MAFGEFIPDSARLNAQLNAIKIQNGVKAAFGKRDVRVTDYKEVEGGRIAATVEITTPAISSKERIAELGKECEKWKGIADSRRKQNENLHTAVRGLRDEIAMQLREIERLIRENLRHQRAKTEREMETLYTHPAYYRDWQPGRDWSLGGR